MRFSTRRVAGLLGLCSAGLTLLSGGKADAGCRPRIAVSQTTGVVVVKPAAAVVVTPFAVPVAVPVAVVARPTVFYAANGYLDERYGSSRRYAERPSERARFESAAADDRIPSEPAPASGVIARACASCHAGASPPGGMNLSRLAQLSSQDRLRAVARMVSEDPGQRMPPGRALSPAELGRALQELSAAGAEGHLGREAPATDR